LESIVLEGSYAPTSPKLVAEFEYRKLGCMSGLVGDKVLVLKLSPRTSAELERQRTSLRRSDKDGTGLLVGSIEDIIDAWGPGVLMSDPDTPYGERVHSVLIGGGRIALHTLKDFNERSHDEPLYHWGPVRDPVFDTNTFNIRERLRIGAISIQSSCPLDPKKSRKASEFYLDNLGTEADYWSLAQRQLMFQGGQYVGLQVGNVYSKLKGRSLKTTMLDMWRVMPDFRILLQPWGLQVSLCTGVARRVPLKSLMRSQCSLILTLRHPKTGRVSNSTLGGHLMIILII
jgi:hypothetical protein